MVLARCGAGSGLTTPSCLPISAIVCNIGSLSNLSTKVSLRRRLGKVCERVTSGLTCGATKVDICEKENKDIDKKKCYDGVNNLFFFFLILFVDQSVSKPRGFDG